MERAHLVRHRMELRYDGTGFQGWAKQPGEITVQGSLEAAFSTVIHETPRLTVAGRTDAGVHAWRQTVSLDLRAGINPQALRRSLNALTPRGLVIPELSPAAATFDARRDALSRSYRYFLWLGEVENPFLRAYAWHVGPGLDLPAMSQAAEMLLGRHDLTAFTPTRTEHLVFVRTVSRSRLRIRGELAWVEIEAPSFLRHMVRVLVGTLVEIGRGWRAPEQLQNMLEGAARPAAGPTAPARGLFLWRIRYPAEGSPGIAKGA